MLLWRCTRLARQKRQTTSHLCHLDLNATARPSYNRLHRFQARHASSEPPSPEETDAETQKEKPYVRKTTAEIDDLFLKFEALQEADRTKPYTGISNVNHGKIITADGEPGSMPVVRKVLLSVSERPMNGSVAAINARAAHTAYAIRPLSNTSRKKFISSVDSSELDGDTGNLASDSPTSPTSKGDAVNTRMDSFDKEVLPIGQRSSPTVKQPCPKIQEAHNRGLSNDYGLDSCAKIYVDGKVRVTHEQMLRHSHNQPEHPYTPGQAIQMRGLVRNIRRQKERSFVHISDGTTTDPYQAVFPPELLDGISVGSYVELEGEWAESQGKGQLNDLKVNEVLAIGPGDIKASPMQSKNLMSVDHLRHYPHLRLRVNNYADLSRARASIISSAHQFYATNIDSSLYVQPPIITSSDCEGAGEVFTIAPKLRESPQSQTLSETNSAQALPKEKEATPYFRNQKYLTVSSQLHLEAFSAELGNVWTITPAFRAEESDTGRHLSELWMLETELRGSHITLEHLLAHVTSLISAIVKNIANPDPSRLEALQKPFSVETYTNIISTLEQHYASNPKSFSQRPSWNTGLALEHEKWITEHFANNTPIFITNYPRAQKPFYMLPDESSRAISESHQEFGLPSRETVQCFDLLLPYGICETVGGSLREHRLENLIGSMRIKGLLNGGSDEIGLSQAEIQQQRHRRKREEPYPFLKEGESLGALRWYADLRRYGSSPHGGFGLGMDRLLMYCMGVGHVRDVVPFPRTWRNCIA